MAASSSSAHLLFGQMEPHFSGRPPGDCESTGESPRVLHEWGKSNCSDSLRSEDRVRLHREAKKLESLYFRNSNGPKLVKSIELQRELKTVKELRRALRRMDPKSADPREQNEISNTIWQYDQALKRVQSLSEGPRFQSPTESSESPPTTQVFVVGSSSSSSSSRSSPTLSSESSGDTNMGSGGGVDANVLQREVHSIRSEVDRLQREFDRERIYSRSRHQGVSNSDSAAVIRLPMGELIRKEKTLENRLAQMQHDYRWVLNQLKKVCEENLRLTESLCALRKESQQSMSETVLRSRQLATENHNLRASLEDALRKNREQADRIHKFEAQETCTTSSVVSQSNSDLQVQVHTLSNDLQWVTFENKRLVEAVIPQLHAEIDNQREHIARLEKENIEYMEKVLSLQTNYALRNNENENAHKLNQSQSAHPGDLETNLRELRQVVEQYLANRSTTYDSTLSRSETSVGQGNAERSVESEQNETNPHGQAVVLMEQQQNDIGALADALSRFNCSSHSAELPLAEEGTDSARILNLMANYLQRIENETQSLRNIANIAVPLVMKNIDNFQRYTQEVNRDEFINRSSSSTVFSPNTTSGSDCSQLSQTRLQQLPAPTKPDSQTAVES